MSDGGGGGTLLERAGVTREARRLPVAVGVVATLIATPALLIHRHVELFPSVLATTGWVAFAIWVATSPRVTLARVWAFVGLIGLSGWAVVHHDRLVEARAEAVLAARDQLAYETQPPTVDVASLRGRGEHGDPLALYRLIELVKERDPGFLDADAALRDLGARGVLATVFATEQVGPIDVGPPDWSSPLATAGGLIRDGGRLGRIKDAEERVAAVRAKRDRWHRERVESIERFVREGDRRVAFVRGEGWKPGAGEAGAPFPERSRTS